MSARTALRIPSWKQYQHYKPERGTPPWVKLYRSLLENAAYGSLTLEARGFLSQLWLLAAEDEGFNGLLPTVSVIAWRFRMDPKEVERLISQVISVGLVAVEGDASGLLVRDSQLARPEAEAEAEGEVEGEGETDSSPRKRGLSLDPRLRLGLLNGFSIEQVEAWAEAERALAPLWSKEVEGFSFDELLAFIRERFPERLVDPAFHTALSGCPRALAEMEAMA